MTLRIAIVGGGIVGSTAAFYLRNADAQVTLFDDDHGQATKAAAGIISPWLSKRRNKQWYRLARAGADLFDEIVMDAHLSTDSYANTGTIITRADKDDLDELEALAYQRRDDAPAMGEIYRLSQSSIRAMLPFITNVNPGILVTGGARIDGQHFCQALQNAAETKVVHERVTLLNDTELQVGEQRESFDVIVVAVGAWLPVFLTPFNLKTDVRPQKGQLIELTLQALPHDVQQPVLMPEGERDFIPTGNGQLIIGATHENEGGFDLQETDTVITDLLASGQHVIDHLSRANLANVRVGTRAYTSDFAPFFGSLDNHASILVASGLGSSGLTTGPLIGKYLAEMALGQKVDTESYTKPVSTYITTA